MCKTIFANQSQYEHVLIQYGMYVWASVYIKQQFNMLWLTGYGSFDAEKRIYRSLQLCVFQNYFKNCRISNIFCCISTNEISWKKSRKTIKANNTAFLVY